MRQAFIKQKGGERRLGLVHQSPRQLGIWRAAIAWKAKAELHGEPSPFLLNPDAPVRLTMAFFVLQAKRSKKITLRPDLDKLVRSVLDALTGIVYKDDSQVSELTASKRLVRDPKEAMLVLVWGAA